ncbi:MAG TPA: twin-arginine translocase TatA/TatE family subunit [Syntrophomonadaceae bacterium]|nr:twin-arginine translocase TatA/TatE family subunit [Syntrophomonadaceae bacterium]HQE23707.1 twin-arginine translocase TatA/TatE family subunit [Syntrophomonadaceae bacterium]
MFGLIGNFGPWELVLILVIVLIIFGPGKLPQLAESMGKAIKGFRKAQQDDSELPEDKNA